MFRSAQNKYSLIVGAAFLLIGCEVNEDNCAEVLSATDLSTVLDIVETPNWSFQAICERRDFGSMDRHRLSVEIMEACGRVCSAEFVAVTGRVGTLAFLEEEMCVQGIEDPESSIAHAVFPEILAELQANLENLQDCLKEHEDRH